MAHKKKYSRWLKDADSYLTSFLSRSDPFVTIDDSSSSSSSSSSNAVLASFASNFEAQWADGTIKGWEELSGSNDSMTGAASDALSDLGKFKTLETMAKELGENGVKRQLAVRGMKTGRKVKDRSERLWKARGVEDLEGLRKEEPKLFAKSAVGASVTSTLTGAGAGAGAGAGEASNKSLAMLECRVSALIGFLRPIVQATRDRAIRRETQTKEEKERERRDEVEGGLKDLVAKDKDSKEDDDGDSDDDEEEKIYNPKNLPLGWDGKPIAVWLYKLHGLNHFHDCEVSERSERALRKTSSIHTRDESREMAIDILATFTTELTLFHSIRLARFIRFALASIKMHLASLGADLRKHQVPRVEGL